ncbi:MAG: hypothetical protein IPO37_18820 [Saprospiraceae bacterium]|jgi:hypothetical protein|nr:hypothetical protein [Saprospiraceae bacterium]
MTIDNLKFFIENGKFNIDENKEFAAEISIYINSKQAKKSSINMPGNFDELFLSRQELSKLLTHYLNGKLHEWDLEYICSFIELHYCDDDEKINEVLFNFSDPYLGYEINKENVEMALLFLSDKNCELKLMDIKKQKLRESYKSAYCKIE